VNKKINQQQLRRLIREELSRGIPDWAFSEIVDNLVDQAASDLVKVLIVNANQTSTDTAIRNRRYAAANKAAADLRRDRQFKKSVEDRLKEALMIYLDTSV
jgi:hypothetical protein